MKWLDRTAMPSLPYFTLVKTERQWRSALKHIKVTDKIGMLNAGAQGTTHVFSHSNGGTVCIVAIGNWEKRTLHEIYGLLVHEAVHIWQEYRDNTLNEQHPSKELEAYVIQGIAQELMFAFGAKP